MRMVAPLLAPPSFQAAPGTKTIGPGRSMGTSMSSSSGKIVSGGAEHPGQRQKARTLGRIGGQRRVEGRADPVGHARSLGQQRQRHPGWGMPGHEVIRDRGQLIAVGRGPGRPLLPARCSGAW